MSGRSLNLEEASARPCPRLCETPPSFIKVGSRHRRRPRRSWRRPPPVTDLQYVGPFLHQRISGFSLSRNWPGMRLLVVLTIRTISMLERHDRKKWQALNNLTVAKFLTARWRCPGRVAKRLRQFKIWSKRPAWLLGVDLRNRSRRSVIRRYLELCGTPLRTAPFFLVESRASSLRRRSFILGPLN